MLVHNSIYQFRGADMSNILEFEQAFPDVTTILLEQNYRSTQTILDAANAVIEHNISRKPKSLWTDQGHGERIVRYHADDEGDEAQWVAHTIAGLHDAATSAGARSPSSTARTPRAASSKRRSCAPASRTRWSAAPGSTTGARSRTRWPT